MTCTAIFTDNTIDQIVQHEGNFKAIIKREVADLKRLDCGKVIAREFANETEAYDYEERHGG